MVYVQQMNHWNKTTIHHYPLLGTQADSDVLAMFQSGRKKGRKRKGTAVDETFDEELAKQIFDDDECRCATMRAELSWL